MTDLKLTRRSFTRTTSDRETADIAIVGGDLATVSGRENLAQALINRLLTRRGELAKLGHPEYGSRLHELRGMPNNTRTARLAKTYLREALSRERRVAEITSVEVRTRQRETLELGVVIKTTEGSDLEIAVGINL